MNWLWSDTDDVPSRKAEFERIIDPDLLLRRRRLEARIDEVKNAMKARTETVVREA